jgi:hypothetical protein
LKFIRTFSPSQGSSVQRVLLIYRSISSANEETSCCSLKPSWSTLIVTVASISWAYSERAPAPSIRVASKAAIDKDFIGIC